jgi:hypothetical protein
MKKNLFLVWLMVTTINAFAQKSDSLKHIYNNQTIYRYGNSFMKGSDRIRFGELRNEFSMSPIGSESFRLAKKYKSTSAILRLLSIVTGIATISFIASNNGNSNKIYIGLGSQIALGLAASHYQLLFNQQTDKALWQRNKDILFR